MLRANWTGEEWQTHCRQLLAMRYGVNIQFIPDRDRGDGGLEAHVLNEPVVFQCYAAQEAYDTTSLTEAQKSKIRADVKKLSDDLPRTQRLIGTQTRVERWVLLAPEYDSKDLVAYARMKSVRVRTEDPCPQWCHPQNFEIVVHNDELFAAERAILSAANPVRLHLDVTTPSRAEAVRQVGVDAESKLRAKLRIDPGLAAAREDLEEYLCELLLDYVRGNEQKRQLQNYHTATFFQVKRQADGVLRGLTRFMTARRGAEAVDELTERLSNGISAEAPSLSPVLCQDLARHYVAEWFLECPLRFSRAGRSA